MSDSLIDKYAKRPSVSDERLLEDADGAEDLGCFGWLRGVRDRAIMLELRKKDGHVMAFGYAWLERAEFDPSEGITLHIAGRQVRITGPHLKSEGRPLTRLFDGIVRHRVPWIREAAREEVLSDQTRVLIERIDWEE